MSFDLICKNCGAPSSPSTGVCPYCKNTFANTHKDFTDIAPIQSLYDSGNYADALAAASQYEKSKNLAHDSSLSPEFILLYVQILIDCDAPVYKLQSLLNSLLINDPENSAAKEYLEISQAKSALRPGYIDPGETVLKKILQKSPNNVHALFLLGTHLFWEENNIVEAARHMEKCVTLRPNMKRAWGCLVALYKKQGNVILQKKSAEKYLSLEKDPNIINFIKKEFL